MVLLALLPTTTRLKMIGYRGWTATSHRLEVLRLNDTKVTVEGVNTQVQDRTLEVITPKITRQCFQQRKEDHP
jgi:hypothetical protein